MSSEDAHSDAGNPTPSIRVHVIDETYPPIKSNLPHSLIQMKQDLTVKLLKARGDWRELEHKEKYNQVQAAKLAGCSRSTLKLAIQKGRLETLPSGWITREQIAAWRGYDPIQVKIEMIASLERDLLRVISEMEEILNSANFGQF